jgi:hypothetical protein
MKAAGENGISDTLHAALERWRLVFAKLADHRALTASKVLLIVDVLLDTLTLARDLREMRRLCDELHRMIRDTRERRARQNGQLH